MKKSTIVIAASLLATIFMFSTNTPKWYVVKDDVVYGCVGTSRAQDEGVCMEVGNETNMFATSYGVSFIGGEYKSFKGPHGDECAVLTRGTFYDQETLCGYNIVDTYEILQYVGK